MALFVEFCEQCGYRPMRWDAEIERLDRQFDDEIRKDFSKFVVIDGEEGDHGDVKHFAGDGSLLAIYRCYGGDDEEYVFMKAGYDFFAPVLLEVIQKQLIEFRETLPEKEVSTVK